MFHGSGLDGEPVALWLATVEGALSLLDAGRKTLARATLVELRDELREAMPRQGEVVDIAGRRTRG